MSETVTRVAPSILRKRCCQADGVFRKIAGVARQQEQGTKPLPSAPQPAPLPSLRDPGDFPNDPSHVATPIPENRRGWPACDQLFCWGGVLIFRTSIFTAAFAEARYRNVIAPTGKNMPGFPSHEVLRVMRIRQVLHHMQHVPPPPGRVVIEQFHQNRGILIRFEIDHRSRCQPTAILIRRHCPLPSIRLQLLVYGQVDTGIQVALDDRSFHKGRRRMKPEDGRTRSMVFERRGAVIGCFAFLSLAIDNNSESMQDLRRPAVPAHVGKEYFGLLIVEHNDRIVP